MDLTLAYGLSLMKTKSSIFHFVNADHSTADMQALEIAIRPFVSKFRLIFQMALRRHASSRFPDGLKFHRLKVRRRTYR